MDGPVDEARAGRDSDDRRDLSGSRRERSRSRERKHKSSKEHKKRNRSRSRDRRRSRSRDRDSRRRRSRSRSRSNRHRRSYSRSRSQDRYTRGPRRHEGSRERSRDRSRSPSLEGGYRPRRRQEIPKVQASMFATNDPFAHLRSKQPMDPQEAMRLWQEQMLKSRQLVLAQQAQSAVQQANKAQRELYIGNLAAGQVNEGMLQQVFNSALIAAFPDAGKPGQEPVIKVNIHSDGRYGFIELRSPEHATAALELNGQINLMNQALSIGRPASYVDPNKVHAAAAQAEAALTAFQQGLPLPPSVVGMPSALAAGSAGAAMAAAGNLAAGGHTAAAAAAGALPAAGAAALPGVLPGGLLAGAAALPGLAGVGGMLPTPYVVVNGMISATTLEDDEDYEEVSLDLKEECEKYGVVKDMVVPRPADPKLARQLIGTGNFGKAFVAFKDAVQSAQARERINGRMFAGVQVTVVYISLEDFEAAKAAAAASGPSAGGGGAADAAAAGVAAVGLVSHGSSDSGGADAERDNNEQDGNHQEQQHEAAQHQQQAPADAGANGSEAVAV